MRPGVGAGGVRHEVLWPSAGTASRGSSSRKSPARTQRVARVCLPPLCAANAAPAPARWWRRQRRAARVSRSPAPDDVHVHVAQGYGLVRCRAALPLRIAMRSRCCAYVRRAPRMACPPEGDRRGQSARGAQWTAPPRACGEGYPIGEADKPPPLAAPGVLWRQRDAGGLKDRPVDNVWCAHRLGPPSNSARTAASLTSA